MRIDRRTSAGRRKRNLAYRRPLSQPFPRGNSLRKRYEFIVEFHDSVRGDSYEIVGTQVEWMELMVQLNKTFGDMSG